MSFKQKNYLFKIIMGNSTEFMLVLDCTEPAAVLLLWRKKNQTEKIKHWKQNFVPSQMAIELEVVSVRWRGLTKPTSVFLHVSWTPQKKWILDLFHSATRPVVSMVLQVTRTKLLHTNGGTADFPQFLDIQMTSLLYYRE